MRERNVTKGALKTILVRKAPNVAASLALLLSSLILSGSASCRGGDPPEWDTPFWLGDNSSQCMKRCILTEEEDPDCQTVHLVCPGDPEFEELIATTLTALERLEEEVLSRCEKWKD